MEKHAKHIVQTGITALSFADNKIQITVGGTEVKMLLAGDATKVWVDGVLYSRAGSPEIQVRVAPVIYTDLQFREVNWLLEFKHYSKESAIGDIADKYGFEKDNFRRQYYKRKGPLMGLEKPSEPTLTSSDTMDITCRASSS